jgi:hypothetical protein
MNNFGIISWCSEHKSLCLEQMTFAFNMFDWKNLDHFPSIKVECYSIMDDYRT